MSDFIALSDISPKLPRRYLSSVRGFDHLLGGGLVSGSAILLAGMPGSGKSTLLMQVAYSLAVGENVKVLYVSGEENKAQIKMRSQRIGINSKKILLSSQTQVEKILKARFKLKPRLVIIDSIQMLWSDKYKQAPATPTQMKYALLTLTGMAKSTGTIVIFVGHSTKGGFIAGLQTLQHMVDVTLYLGIDDENPAKRFLKANKNRFGAIDFIWQTEMTEWGLIDDPNAYIPPAPVEQTATKTVTLTSAQVERMVKDKPIIGSLVKFSMNYLKKRAMQES